MMKISLTVQGNANYVATVGIAESDQVSQHDEVKNEEQRSNEENPNTPFHDKNVIGTISDVRNCTVEIDVRKSLGADESCIKEEKITISSGKRVNLNEILDKCLTKLENLALDEAKDASDLGISQEALQQTMEQRSVHENLPLATIVDGTNSDNQSGITEMDGPHTCVEQVENTITRSEKTDLNEFLDQCFLALEEMHQSIRNEKEMNKANEKTKGGIEGGEKKGVTEKKIEHENGSRENDASKEVPEKSGENTRGKKNDAKKGGKGDNNEKDTRNNGGKRFQVCHS